MARLAHVATVDLTHRFLLLPQLVALREGGHDVTAIGAPGPWVSDVEAEGIRYIAWTTVTRAWDPRADLRAFAELVTILRRERFDAVHTHNPKPGAMGRIAARALRIPVVLNTVHGLWATPEDPIAKRAPVLAAEWAAARCSDLELYQSGEDLDWARRLGIAGRSRSVHLGNGVDVERFSPGRRDPETASKLRAELGIGEDDLVIGAVGRMVREKGFLELFRAARIVRERVPRARFLVLGAGDEAKSDAIAPEQVEAVRDDVVFTGWRNDIPELMAVMDVFTLPSWREGMPRSAIEAAASGLPLVLTDIRGCREVVRDGLEGLLVPVRDADALAEALVRLIEDPELRRRMGAAARRRAEAEFDQRRVVATVVDETERLLRRRGIGGVPGATVVRPARTGDAIAMGRIHTAALPTAFLPTLGEGFLTQLYRELVTDPSAIALVAVRDGLVTGFAAGVRSVDAFYRRFAVRRGALAALEAAPRLRDARVRARLRETAHYPATTEDLPSAELLAIGVDERARGDGVGRALAQGVLRGLARRGVDTCKVVVGADNADANDFYDALGFRRVSTVAVHEGTESNVWVAACRS
jgi:glycosyltransferase involved in cell wall biosynthesis/ribosomal protein S18 acetylase RimI-like enzyme